MIGINDIGMNIHEFIYPLHGGFCSLVDRSHPAYRTERNHHRIGIHEEISNHTDVDFSINIFLSTDE